jgi:hypothetical protein
MLVYYFIAGGETLLDYIHFIVLVRVAFEAANQAVDFYKKINNLKTKKKPVKRLRTKNKK